MKKEYINPDLVVLELRTQGMLANSTVQSLTSNNGAGAGLGFDDQGFDEFDDDM